MQLWEHNKYIDKTIKKENAVVFKVGYDEVINESNEGAYGFIHGFHKNLGIKMKIENYIIRLIIIELLSFDILW